MNIKIVGILTDAVSLLVPKAIEKLFESKPKQDMTRLSERELEKIQQTYKNWKEHPRLYRNQKEFTADVNKRLGIKKSVSTIMRYAKGNYERH